MDRALRYAATAICALLSFSVFGQDSTLIFKIKSNYKYKVQVEFYSQARKHAWPGGSKAYNIDDYEVHSYTLNCRIGEKICYGAWANGDSKTYWGVGLNDRQRCTQCCAQCNGGTISFTLNP
jgi:hypothetical protein